MRIEPATRDLVDRLAQHRTIGRAPRAELEWLVAHGQVRRYDAGDHIARKGQRIEETGLGLEIVLSGHVKDAPVECAWLFEQTTTA